MTTVQSDSTPCHVVASKVRRLAAAGYTRVTAPVTFDQPSVIRALPRALGCAAEANVSRLWRCGHDASMKELIHQLRTLAARRAADAAAPGALIGSAHGIGVNYRGNAATCVEAQHSGRRRRVEHRGIAARAARPVIDVSVALQEALEILVSVDDRVLPPEALQTPTWHMLKVVLSATAGAAGQPGDVAPGTALAAISRS